MGTPNGHAQERICAKCCTRAHIPRTRMLAEGDLIREARRHPIPLDSPDGIEGTTAAGIRGEVEVVNMVNAEVGPSYGKTPLTCGGTTVAGGCRQTDPYATCGCWRR